MIEKDRQSQRARSVAAEAHSTQKYGDKPYMFHVDAVAELVKDFGDEAIVVAYLHDVVEDTKITSDDIKAMFGERIAKLVYFVTDEPGPNRRERKRVTNDKLAKVPEEFNTALIVKAADRLANMSTSEKMDMYCREYPEFRKAVHRPGLCDKLWESLDKLGAHER